MAAGLETNASAEKKEERKSIDDLRNQLHESVAREESF